MVPDSVASPSPQRGAAPMVTVTVPARLSLLGVLRGAIAGLETHYAGQAPAPTAMQLYAWGLAVYEAATNVVRHGYGGECDRTLHLTLEPRADRVIFTLEDEGRPHPSWPAAAPAVTPDQEGGLGLMVIHQVMDEATYRPGQGSPNRLRLVARLEPPRTGRPPADGLGETATA